MIKEKSSTTAVGTALRRAIESKKNEEKRLFCDPFAHYFVPPNSTLMGQSIFPNWLIRIYLDYWKEIGVSNLVIVRTRFFDDAMKKAIHDGVEQFVILGAGFDSRAYRLFSPDMKLSVFEVDFPATQNRKKEIMKNIQGFPFSHVRYVPVDFTQDLLEESLKKYGYQKTLKTFFLWEGVSFYLTEEAVRNTLTFIAEHSIPGSSVLFDYLHFMPSEKFYTRKTWHDKEEPLQWGIAPEKTPFFLNSLGFCDIQNESASSAGKRYYDEKKLRRRFVSPTYSFVQAVVAGID
ncbi:MAG: SAM-dependent methyltransferase [Planctomycetaceae bacterium]|jgi:methyltransferase (TIGR00027 family)|nr:SAM-dependent methyltransferase [Planctomycetaceae bacterium]